MRRYLGLLILMTFVCTLMGCGGSGGSSGNSGSGGSSNWDNVSSSDWMKYVDGNLRISQINIPGTHDSGTQYVDLSNWSQCQNTSIVTQLENGIRFLDIRLEGEVKSGTVKLRLVHGTADCKQSSSGGNLYLDTVLNACYSFLNAHPTETIIMSVKKDDGSVTEAQIQKAICDTYIGNNLSKYWFTQNGKPSLNQVRGKIVLARRFSDLNGYGDTRSGLNFTWSDQGSTSIVSVPYDRSQVTSLTALWVQDRYKYSASDKWAAVKYGLDRPAGESDRANAYFLNFMSTAGNSVLSGPSSYANTVNRNFLSYTMTSGKAYAWIIMDFATKPLAKHVYASNIFKAN